MDTVRHFDLGAYVLGALDDEEGRGFEAHVARCPRCRTELAELSEVAAVLRRQREELASEVTGGAAPPVDPARLAPVDLTSRPARSGRRRAFVLAAAAVLIAAAGGVGLGATALSGPDTTETSSDVAIFQTGTTHSATDPRTGARGTVALESTSWGTEVALRLTNVDGPLECELIAVEEDGDEQVAAGWTIPAGGYNEASGPLTFRGGVASSPDAIERFVVRTADDEDLLTIQA